MLGVLLGREGGGGDLRFGEGVEPELDRPRALVVNPRPCLDPGIAPRVLAGLRARAAHLRAAADRGLDVLFTNMSD